MTTIIKILNYKNYKKIKKNQKKSFNIYFKLLQKLI